MVEVFKIVLIGDYGVGKTNLLSSLIDSPCFPFEPRHISTIDAYRRNHLIHVFSTCYCVQCLLVNLMLLDFYLLWSVLKINICFNKQLILF